MIALVLALTLAAPKPAPFKPIEVRRGKVTLPVLGLELDLTPPAGGMGGALWRITSEVDIAQGRGRDVLEARINSDVIGVAEVVVIHDNDCESVAVGAAQKMVTNVAGTWWNWEFESEGVPSRILCIDANDHHPAISIQRRWLDPKFKVPGGDDPVLSAVAFALRDATYGPARPLTDPAAKRFEEPPKTVKLLDQAITPPSDGALWVATEDKGTTLVTRVLPVLPLASLVVQRAADPGACPAKLKKNQWGALGPTLRCRPLKVGALLIELRGPTDATAPWLEPLARLK